MSGEPASMHREGAPARVKRSHSCSSSHQQQQANWGRRIGHSLTPKDGRIGQFLRAAAIQSFMLTGKKAAASFGQIFGSDNGQDQAQQEHYCQASAVRLAGSEVCWTGFTTCQTTISQIWKRDEHQTENHGHAPERASMPCVRDQSQHSCRCWKF